MMLFTLVGRSIDPSLLLLILALIVCFVPATILRKRAERVPTMEKETFATTLDIETVYDMVIKEAETWREYSMASNTRSFNPIKWRRPKFAVYKEVRPRLYRIVDRNVGVMTFELTPIDGGGTTVKISHWQEGRYRVKAFKAKLPVKDFSSLNKTCPSCKKIYPPEYTHCPFCGVELL